MSILFSLAVLGATPSSSSSSSQAVLSLQDTHLMRVEGDIPCLRTTLTTRLCRLLQVLL